MKIPGVFVSGKSKAATTNIDAQPKYLASWHLKIYLRSLVTPHCIPRDGAEGRGRGTGVMPRDRGSAEG